MYFTDLESISRFLGTEEGIRTLNPIGREILSLLHMPILPPRLTLVRTLTFQKQPLHYKRRSQDESWAKFSEDFALILHPCKVPPYINILRHGILIPSFLSKIFGKFSVSLRRSYSLSKLPSTTLRAASAAAYASAQSFTEYSTTLL